MQTLNYVCLILILTADYAETILGRCTCSGPRGGDCFQTAFYPPSIVGAKSKARTGGSDRWRIGLESCSQGPARV